MKYLHRLLAVASAAFFIASSALAQNAGSVTNHGFAIGKGAGTTGYTSLLCGSAQLAVGQAAADPICQTITGDVTITAAGVTAIGANKVTNAKLATAADGTIKSNISGGTATPSDNTITAVLDKLFGTTQGSVIYRGASSWAALGPSTAGQFLTTQGAGANPIWSAGATGLLTSRALAITQNLSGLSVVTTQGYATAGDGGGATFKNVGSAAFADSGILTGTLTAGGSGYTNGTYLYVTLTGGSGSNAIASVTVSGGAVTSVTIRGTGGNAYTAGDVLSASNSFLGGSGSGFTWTVSTVSTPTGSFTDAGGNHWQITPDQGNFINVRQFGAKVDWTGNDATATNDFTAIQNAYNYASIVSGPTIDAGGAAGAKVIHPRGTSLVCSTNTPLHVPMGVSVEGHNAWSSTLKMCTTWNNAVHFITLCDPNTHVACFGTRLHNLTLFAVFTQVSATATAMIYSNNIQQIDVLDRVAIYAGQRSCIRLETGFGGAALLGMQNIECTPSNVGSQNPGIFINYGTTLVTMRNVHVEGSGPAVNSGIQIIGGFVDLVGFHTEGWNVGIEVNIPTSNVNGIVRVHTISGGASCTNLVLKQGGSAANSLIVGQAIQNGCTNTVNNGGTATTTTIVGDTVF